MTAARLLLLLLACGGLLVCAASAGSVAVPGFAGCGSKAEVRPRTILVACGDGNFWLSRLRWTRWDGEQAAATGLGHQNDCAPDCARGHFHTYAVSVRLSGPVVCAKLKAFSELSWRFVHAKPPGVLPTGSETFPCHARHARP